MATDYRKLFFENNKGWRGKYKCSHCGEWFSKEDITIDHIIPQSTLLYLPVKDILINLQPMCRSCNSRKGNRLTNTNVGKDLAKNIIRQGITKFLK